MTQTNKTAENRVTTNVLQSALLESADHKKLQIEIKQKFGVDISAKELEQMASFYQLLDRIKTDYAYTKTM